MDKYACITTKSPGGRSYKFQIKDTPSNRQLIMSCEEDPAKMLGLLKQLKKKGIQPLESATASNKQDQVQVPVPIVKNNESLAASSTARSYEVEANNKNDAAGAKQLDGNQISKADKPKAKSKKLQDLRVHEVLKDKLLIFNVEKRLLEEVFKRPPLYDHKLDFSQRTPDMVYQHYEEIAILLCDEIGVDLHAKNIEKTFVHFKGLYTQYKNLSSLKSGSGTNKIPTPPMHVEILRQLDSVAPKREQFSSLSDERFDLKPPTKRKNQDEAIEPLLKNATEFLSKINSQSSTCCHPSSGSEEDPDRSYFVSIVSDFKKLKPRDQRAIKSDINEKIRIS